MAPDTGRGDKPGRMGSAPRIALNVSTKKIMIYHYTIAVRRCFRLILGLQVQLGNKYKSAEAFSLTLFPP